MLGVLLMANLLVIAAWLSEAGFVEIADKIRSEFLTGTAITILAALLILSDSSHITSVGFLVSDRGAVARRTDCGILNWSQ